MPHRATSLSCLLNWCLLNLFSKVSLVLIALDSSVHAFFSSTAEDRPSLSVCKDVDRSHGAYCE